MQTQPFLPQLMQALPGTHYSWVGWSNMSEVYCSRKHIYYFTPNNYHYKIHIPQGNLLSRIKLSQCYAINIATWLVSISVMLGCCVCNSSYMCDTCLVLIYQLIHQRYCNGIVSVDSSVTVQLIIILLSVATDKGY